MIRKALITAVGLLIVHSIVVYVRPTSGTQYQLQHNIAKAQHFIYREVYPNVLIGSSLSNRLVMDSLPNFYNLSFTGMGVFDGLNVLSLHTKYPKNVFIEMNVILREENGNFLSYINSPILGPLKKYIPSLRDAHQPAGMFGEEIVSKLKSESVAGTQTNDINSAQGESEMFTRLLNQEIQNYSEMPELETIDDRFERLNIYVSLLQAQGVNVFFFELPVHHKLCDLQKPKIIREYFIKSFPPNEFTYITMPDCSEYKTTDGVHLDGEEALRYTKYFRDQTDAIETIIDSFVDN